MVCLYSVANVVSASFDTNTYEDFDVNAKNTRLVDGTSVIVKILDDDEQVLNTLTFTTFDPTNSNWSDSINCHIGDSYFKALVSYTEISICSSSLVNSLLNTSYTENVKLTDEIFVDFKDAFDSEFGITIKGSNINEVIDLFKYFEDESY